MPRFKEGNLVFFFLGGGRLAEDHAHDVNRRLAKAGDYSGRGAIVAPPLQLGLHKLVRCDICTA